MAYLKPQSPLYHKTEDAYFYPLTTADQVIMEDGNRLNVAIDSLNIISKTTTEDNGKFFRVENGIPVWSHIQSAEEANF